MGNTNCKQSKLGKREDLHIFATSPRRLRHAIFGGDAKTTELPQLMESKNLIAGVTNRLPSPHFAS